MLLSFDESTRRIWMFPRCIRYIEPWKLHQILNVLMMHSNNLDHFSTEDQKLIYRLFDEVGIKRKGETRDNNPGGTRTYYAQLETLGLVYSSSPNKYDCTLAGQAIVDGENPLRALQYQLLRHQYPSSYGKGPNVRIDTRMKVKPFLFLLKLLHDDRLQRYLTDDDIMIPVIYGHNHNCYDLCVQKILDYRKSRNILDVIDSPSQDLYTRKGTSENALDNIHNIANTASNYLRAASLITQSPKQKTPKAYEFNEMYEELYNDFLDEYDVFIDLTKSSKESFQRSYGRYLNQKDTRKSSGLTSFKNHRQVFIQVGCFRISKW